MDGFVSRAQSGDRQAAHALLTELLPRVRNLVRYFVRGDDDVDDIAQEALLAILLGLSGYRGDGAFKSWVDRIVARTVFAWLKKARRARDQMTARPIDLVIVRDASPSPDQYVLRRDAMRSLDELPLEQRHVLVLHHVLEMTVPEIAEEVSVPEETVRSRLRLARGRLAAAREVADPEGRAAS